MIVGRAGLIRIVRTLLHVHPARDKQVFGRTQPTVLLFPTGLGGYGTHASDDRSAAPGTEWPRVLDGRRRVGAHRAPIRWTSRWPPSPRPAGSVLRDRTGRYKDVMFL